jgi:abortive infection bacteriophage resistance protein
MNLDVFFVILTISDLIHLYDAELRFIALIHSFRFKLQSIVISIKGLLELYPILITIAPSFLVVKHFLFSPVLKVTLFC